MDKGIFKATTDLPVDFHLLPCRIDYEGIANFKKFFVIKGNSSTLRGRGLRGKDLDCPYKTVLIRKVGDKWKFEKKSSNSTVWCHDQTPSKENSTTQSMGKPNKKGIDFTKNILPRMLKYLMLLTLAFANLKCISVDSKQEILVTEQIINDNYCDCVDGQDEPLTSACYQNEFTCTQQNAQARIIPSWMVDDLKCDCCDGMDEHEIKCLNTCKELGKEQKALEEIQRIILDEGLKNRNNLIKKAKTALEKDKFDANAKQLELNELVKEEASYREMVKIWTSKKERADYQREEKRREQCPEILELQNARASLSEKEKEIIALNDEIRTNGEKYNNLLESYHKLYAKVDETIEQRQAMQKGELETFHLSNSGIVDQAVDPEEDNRVVNDNQDFNEDDFYTEDKSQTPGDEHAAPQVEDNCPATLIGLGICIPDMLLTFLPEFTLSSTESKLDPTIVQSILEKHQKKLDDHVAKQSALSKEIADIQARIKKDFGPDRVWQGLDQTCVSYDDIEYIYEVCLFGSAKQKSKKDSSEISLGNFIDFKDRSDNMDPSYKTMIYKYGQAL